MTKVLKAENLIKKYGDFYAVNDIDLNLNKGEVVGLLGPNGAGKTTTFYMITGMIRPSSGKIIFEDKDITKSPMYKRARMGIGYLAQEPSIFGKLNVEDNKAVQRKSKKILFGFNLLDLYCVHFRNGKFSN